MKVQTKSELLLFFNTFIWGSTFVAIKSILDYSSPFVFITARFSVAAILFTFIFFNKLRAIQKSTLRKGILLGILLGVGLSLQTIGLNYTTASKSSFITGMLVIFTPLAQVIMKRKIPKLATLIGVVIVSIGLYFLTSPEGNGINIGDVLTLISAIIFGIHIVYLDVVTQKENVLHITFLQIAVTALIGIFCIPLETPKLIFSSTFIWLVLYLGFLATVLTLTIQTKFQKETTPTRAAIIYTFEPVVTAILAYIFLQEFLGTWGIVGGVLIIAGILISELSPKK